MRLAVSPGGTQSCSRPLLPYRCQLLPDALRAEVARLGGAEVEEAGRTAAVESGAGLLRPLASGEARPAGVRFEAARRKTRWRTAARSRPTANCPASAEGTVGPSSWSARWMRCCTACGT